MTSPSEFAKVDIEMSDTNEDLDETFKKVMDSPESGAELKSFLRRKLSEVKLKHDFMQAEAENFSQVVVKKQAFELSYAAGDVKKDLSKITSADIQKFNQRWKFVIKTEVSSKGSENILVWISSADETFTVQLTLFDDRDQVIFQDLLSCNPIVMPLNTIQTMVSYTLSDSP